jgi:porin
MGSPLVRFRIVAATAISWSMLIASTALAQEETPEPTASPSFGRPLAPAGPPNFDAGQETPAAPVTPVPAPSSDRYRSQSSRFLFEDVFPLHALSEELGLSVYVSSIQFEQGVAAGGFEQAFRWGSRFDMLAHLNSGKLGLWEGGTIDLFAESRLGQSVDTFSGTFSPPNLAMFFPVPNQDITAITGLKFTQAINDWSGMFFGKLNALNGDPERFLKYPLTARFWNAAFNFNLALDRYPYSAPGAGFYAAPEGLPALAFLVLDSFSSPRTSGFENLFRNGVFLYSQAQQSFKLLDLPGSLTLAGLYGTGSFSDLSPASFVELPAEAVFAPKKTGTWTILWRFDQRLWADADNPDRGLGLYVQMGVGDGNPNPARWFSSVALCGNSPLPDREGDTYGIGVYDLAPSAQAMSQAPGLRNEYGVELFYNVRIKPGCHLTPDLQVLHPGLARVDTALVLGLRLKLDF